MPIDARAIGIRPVTPERPTKEPESVQRRDSGAVAGGFRPQTNVALRTAISDLAGTLERIATSEKLGMEKIPSEIHQMIRNILEQSLSLKETLGKGIGSTIESQRFSMEQLSTFGRMLFQLGSLADKGFSMKISPEMQTLLTQFKNLLVATEGGNALEPVLMTKSSFELLDSKNPEQLPQVMFEILSRLAQPLATHSSQPQQESDIMNLLNKLVKYFMPRPESDDRPPTPQNQQPMNQNRSQQNFQQPLNQNQPQNQFQQPLNQNQPQNQFQQPLNQNQPQNNFQQPLNQNQPQNNFQQPLNQNQPQNNFQQPLNQNQPQNNFQQPLNQNQPQNQFQQPFNQNQPQNNFQQPLNQNQPQNNFQQPLNQNQPQNNFQQPLNQNQPQNQFQQPFNQNQPQNNFQQPFNQNQQQNQFQQPLNQNQPQNNFQQPLNQNQPQNQFQQPLNQNQPQNNFQQPLNQNQPQNQFQQPFNQNQPQNNFQQPFNQNQPQNNFQQPLNQNQPQNNFQQPLNQNHPQNNFQQPFNQNHPQNQFQQPLNQNQPQNQFQQPLNQNQPQNNFQQPLNQNQPQNNFQQPLNQNQPQNQFQQPFNQNQPQNNFQQPFNQNQPQNNFQQPPMSPEEFIAQQQNVRQQMQAARLQMLRQPMQNHLFTMETMKGIARVLIQNQEMNQQDMTTLQNFANSPQLTFTREDVRHLQNLMRLCQQNVPATVRQAAVQQDLPDLPRLWAFMQMCDMAKLTASQMTGRQFRRAGKDVADFANSMRKAMSGENFTSNVQTQRSFQMMVPIYLNVNEMSYPTYLNVYDESNRDNETGADKKETWLRICVLTDNIGAAELIFRVYEGDQLDMRFYFSQGETAGVFATYVDELREAMQGINLQLGEIRIGSIGATMEQY